MSDEDGIRRTLVRYTRLFDAKRWDELATIFTEDASIVSRRGTFTGRSNVIADLKSAMTPEYEGLLFASKGRVYLTSVRMPSSSLIATSIVVLCSCTSSGPYALARWLGR